MRPPQAHSCHGPFLSVEVTVLSCGPRTAGGTTDTAGGTRWGRPPLDPRFRSGFQAARRTPEPLPGAAVDAESSSSSRVGFQTDAGRQSHQEDRPTLTLSKITRLAQDSRGTAAAQAGQRSLPAMQESLDDGRPAARVPGRCWPWPVLTSRSAYRARWHLRKPWVGPLGSGECRHPLLAGRLRMV